MRNEPRSYPVVEQARRSSIAVKNRDGIARFFFLNLSDFSIISLTIPDYRYLLYMPGYPLLLASRDIHLISLLLNSPCVFRCNYPLFPTPSSVRCGDFSLFGCHEIFPPPLCVLCASSKAGGKTFFLRFTSGGLSFTPVNVQL